MIQVCSDLHRARVFITNPRPYEINMGIVHLIGPSHEMEPFSKGPAAITVGGQAGVDHGHPRGLIGEGGNWFGHSKFDQAFELNWGPKAADRKVSITAIRVASLVRRKLVRA